MLRSHQKEEESILDSVWSPDDLTLSACMHTRVCVCVCVFVCVARLKPIYSKLWAYVIARVFEPSPTTQVWVPLEHFYLSQPDHTYTLLIETLPHSTEPVIKSLVRYGNIVPLWNCRALEADYNSGFTKWAPTCMACPFSCL